LIDAFCTIPISPSAARKARSLLYAVRMNRSLAFVCPALLLACSSPSGPVNPATGDGGEAPIFSDPGGNGSPSPSSDGGVVAHDGGSPASNDGAAPPPPATGDAGGPVNAFTGAPAYVATLGPSARNARHAGLNPAGSACLSCHDGQKGVVAFLFGGTVWKDANATAPASSVEVRVLDASGVALHAYSDGDGNFFFPATPQTTKLAAPAHAGLRDATSTRTMTNLINDADCNGCHRSGGEARLAVQ
jgi:hypothetical protein